MINPPGLDCEASLQRSSQSTPLPELLMVAENLTEMSQKTHQMIPELNLPKTPISRLKREIVDNIPDDWHSTSSFNSDLLRLESNIRTIAEQLDSQSKFSCAFAAIYSFLCFFIVMLITLTIFFNFTMILLVSMVVIVVIIIVIVSNFYVIVNQL